MEHIITSNIMAHADKHRILHPHQHGFRKGLSCDTQLVDFVDDVTKNQALNPSVGFTSYSIVM
jgi:hypothetical protein